MSADSCSAWAASASFPHLLWRSWDEEHFVFNPRSGETHVLNELAAAMLRVLAERPHTAPELVARFQGDLAGGDPAEREQAVRGLLMQLDQLGLVDCESP